MGSRLATVDFSQLDAEYELRASKRDAERSRLYPHQTPPNGDWDVWILLGGRGSGKTHALSHVIVEHLRKYRDKAWVMIIAPTIDDARSVCIEGPSGLETLFGNEFLSYNKSLLRLEHAGGGRVKAYGAEEPNRLRGPQSSLLVVDEIAIIAEESIDNANFGLRLGDHPKMIAGTTPRNRKFLRELLTEEGTVVSRATTDDNPALPERARRRFHRKYDGTRIGRQELYAELIEDIEGAMWESSWIDEHRVSSKDVPDLDRVVVAIDPAVSTGKRSAQTGIGAAGRGIDGRYYVLKSIGMKVTPGKWAKRAIDVYRETAADRILGEINNGGDMVEATIRNEWVDAPFEMIRASRGKTVRAEPISTLYEQGRVSHVGEFPELEDQMCTFPIENELDDQLDAVVYALTELSEGIGEELLIGRIGDGVIGSP